MREFCCRLEMLSSLGGSIEPQRPGSETGVAGPDLCEYGE